MKSYLITINNISKLLITISTKQDIAPAMTYHGLSSKIDADPPVSSALQNSFLYIQFITEFKFVASITVTYPKTRYTIEIPTNCQVFSSEQREFYVSLYSHKYEYLQ